MSNHDASRDRRQPDGQSAARRAGDAQTAPSRDRRRTPAGLESPRRRRTDFITRYRQPIVGLGLLGAAAPLVHVATSSANRSTDASDSPASAAAQPESEVHAAAQSGKLDAEEHLAGRIAESREQDARTKYVTGAVTRYDITEALAGDIYDIAQQEGVDPEVAIGLVRTESTFNERAQSGVGARGLTQVMPKTARWLIPGTKANQLYDRKTNLRLGFRYLNQLVGKYRGNVHLALTAYNRGPGTVDKVLKRGGDPDNGYAGKVLGS